MAAKTIGWSGGGYRKVYATLNRVFNFTFALLFLILSLPVFIVIAAAIKLADRGPVFYRGVRLGLNKEPFMMYKFRTLVPDAEKIIGAQLLSAGHKLENPIGKLLRETRLDELPQLFNVLKGDMDFVGPRPERPVIYEKICRHIRNYDVRFTVKPGLIGYAQLFTPHSTPKEIRAYIDNRFVRYKQKFAMDIAIMFYTVAVILYKAVKKIIRYVRRKARMHGSSEKRTFERIRQESAKVYIGSQDENRTYKEEALIVDINEEAFSIRCGHKIEPHHLVLMLQTERKNGKGVKKKVAFCMGEIYKEAKENGFYSYVIKYKPASPLNFYMVHQYFLHKSIV
jgi:lipopolysaccharide/colanic/teichoic acid biosynthesis glycosyltransferase